MHPAIQAHLDATYFGLYQSLRSKLMDSLSDRDLSTTLGGSTLPLGVLCLRIGEVERDYVESFRTHRLTFEHRHPDPSIATSVERLKAWYGELDADLMAVLELLTGDMATRPIQRGNNPGEFDVTPMVELDIYREALIVFYGKVSVYLRGLDRPLTGLWAHWIE